MAADALGTEVHTTLDRMPAGECATISQIHGGHGVRNRLGGLGLHPGDTVRMLRASRLGGPVLIEIHDVAVAIGRGMAQAVEVELAP